MLRAFEAFAIGLQAVAQVVLEQPRHHLHARLMPVPAQRGDEVALAPGRPQQWRFGITTRRGFDERLHIRQQGRILLRRLLAIRPRLAHARLPRAASTRVRSGAAP
jgi:hypothetical protein